jgi:hypothetical protein
MKRFGSAVLAAGALLVGSALHAQAPQIGLGVGLTMPMGDYGDIASSGFHALGNVAFKLGPSPLKIRADLSYHRTGLEGGLDGNTSLIGGMANVVYTLPSPVIKPYFLAGVGYFSEKLSGGGGSVSDNGFAYGAGAGLNFGLAAFSMFVEAKYLSIGSNDTFDSANLFPITVGLRFGGK